MIATVRRVKCGKHVGEGRVSTLTLCLGIFSPYFSTEVSFYLGQTATIFPHEGECNQCLKIPCQDHYAS